MRNAFVYNGRSSLEFDMLISGGGTFASPERSVSQITVPGRNGDLMIDNGRYNNVNITYEAAIARGFQQRFDAFRMFLLSEPGYHRLEDTYHPAEYRVAAYTDRMTPEMVGTMCRAGKFDIVFNCKPQRFLKVGDIPIRLESAGVLKNRWMPARPIIKVYGDGAGILTVGSTIVRMTEIDEYVELDCDTENAYKESENKNSAIYTPQGFPLLAVGDSEVSWSGGITDVEIVPRWWVI